MKKLLSALLATTVISASATTAVSCTAPKVSYEWSKTVSNTLINSFSVKNLGELNNLKPLTSSNDANILNTDNKGTFPHFITGFRSYSNADNRIGTYEIANVLFKKNGISPTMYNLYSFTFKLSRDNTKVNGYKMLVQSQNGKSFTCYFTSNKDIQLSLNSVIDDTKTVHVKDGNVHTIEEAFEKLAPADKEIKLGVWNREIPNGWRTINIDPYSGKGTIQLYDSTQQYGGFINAKVEIDNYVPLSFDWFGNQFNFYNDRTAEQNQAMKTIDTTYSNTTINPKKHVILFGFDGIRYDKYLEYEKPHLEKGAFTDYAGVDEEPYYSQPSESVFGWKQDLTGSIDGNSVNIFKMVNNSAGGKAAAIGNFMWDAFETKVFAQHDKSGMQNINESFAKGPNRSTEGFYNNDGISKYEHVWINKAKYIIDHWNDEKHPEWKVFKDTTIPSYHGTIDSQAYKNGIWHPTENEKKFSLLKTVVTYEITKDMAKSYASGREDNNLPNLIFNYDTEEDDEGHAFDDFGEKSNIAFYDSDMAHDTFKEYAREMNKAYEQFGKNPDYLIMQIVDHGRNSVDSGHSPWDPDTRKGWIVSNISNLEDYISTGQKKDINQYSIKEIIWNWLTRQEQKYE